MERSTSDGQHRHGKPTLKVNCLFCKSEATIPIRCSCGYIRCQVCHAHRDVSAMQGFIDQEFGCRNPSCPDCDHDFLGTTKSLQELLKQLGKPRGDGAH